MFWLEKYRTGDRDIRSDLFRKLIHTLVITRKANILKLFLLDEMTAKF